MPASCCRRTLTRSTQISMPPGLVQTMLEPHQVVALERRSHRNGRSVLYLRINWLSTLPSWTSVCTTYRPSSCCKRRAPVHSCYQLTSRYSGTPEVDKEITDLFLQDLKRAEATELIAFDHTGYNALAAIVLMDQLTRCGLPMC